MIRWDRKVVFGDLGARWDDTWALAGAGKSSLVTWAFAGMTGKSSGTMGSQRARGMRPEARPKLLALCKSMGVSQRKAAVATIGCPLILFLLILSIEMMNLKSCRLKLL